MSEFAHSLSQVKSGRIVKYKRLFFITLLLCFIAGIETTILLYTADQKNMDVLNGITMNDLGVGNFIIQTIGMGLFGLLFTFIVQIIIVYLLLKTIFKEKSVSIKGIWLAVISMGIWLVIGSGVNAVIALLVSANETTFTSLALFVENSDSLFHTLVAEFELFYIIGLIFFSLSLEKNTAISRRKSILITVTIALLSLAFHVLTVSSGTYLK